MSTDAALLRLLQLASPALPVGAYAYSQGLEYAVEAGWTSDENSVLAWIRGVLVEMLAWTDLPMLLRLHTAWSESDETAVSKWNAHLYAMRETAELRAEDHQLGSALAQVLHTLDIEMADRWREAHPACFATLFALAASQWRIAPRETLLGYAWAWVENQVAAAIKVVPLGQAAAQRMMSSLQPDMVDAVTVAFAVPDANVGRSMPGMVMASAKHARLYSRLFRS